MINDSTDMYKYKLNNIAIPYLGLYMDPDPTDRIYL